MTEFNSEAEFEAALVADLQQRGWGKYPVLKHKTEAELLDNWAEILFEHNRGVDKLNEVPLTETEMQQIIEQIRELKTPLKLNGFINGKSVSIIRDNPEDKLHYGKEVSLDIFNPRAIAGGNTRYQIAQQPQFERKSTLARDRRGDLMLLINGMPLIHIELKRSGVPVSHATNQIQKYTAEGAFTGLFALVQVFVAMSPSETRYFANPGMEGSFNPSYFFNWADINNEPMNHWKDIASTLLSIPMAHQLIGFYTIADQSDGVLKVMRSYQYYAANAISDKVSKTHWADKNRLGGYVWHTTGSGKTMTSFKSAQLIANSQDADKVIFLVDRIELGDQSHREYNAFAADNETVQATNSTHALITKLKSDDPANTLIVSSIQKLSNIKQEVNDEGVSLQSHDIEQINQKRIVFIVDEAHRSTFGDMLITIKQTFTTAMFFGFTGTPINKENQKKNSTTAMVFGDELHRYSIADGIRDKNVLGFDPYMVETFRARDLRREIGLIKAKANTEAEVFDDPKKTAIFNHYMHEVPMAGYKDENGTYVKGIEDDVPKSQYADVHKGLVVADIQANWLTLSQGSKFHAILATDNIPDAIDYYRRIKTAMPELRITALFDPHENEGADPADTAFKQAGLLEIIDDYNQRFGQKFDLANHGKFKKDLSARLAHKKPYLRVAHEPAQQLDLLIVVDQMLTGFDSKWLNTLYLDKVLRYENIIQAFSRTNRLFGPDKPFGTIRYYRYPHTMKRNIDAAVKAYSGDKVTGLFVDQIESNLKKLNACYADIAALFKNAGVDNFEKLPDDNSERGQFAKLFRQLNQYLEAARIQGFVWATDTVLDLSEHTYLILALRYKELSGTGGGRGGDGDVPFDIAGHLNEIDTGKIDADYMNSRFEKFLKTRAEGANAETIQLTIDELHKSFASLSQDEQKYAAIFLRDVQRGDVTPEAGKTFRDYITEYQNNAKNSQVRALIDLLAIDKANFGQQLTAIMSSKVTEANLNEFGRFDALKAGVDKTKAKAYFEAKEGVSISPFKVNVRVDTLLRNFVISGGFDLEQV